MAGKVLVTGARGMLGHALGSSCPAGFQMIPSDRPLADARADAEDALTVAGVRRPVEPLDICDRAALAGAIERHNPVAVLNAAAFTQVDLCETRFADALQVNGVAPGLLAETCATAGIPLLHVSTDFVFAGDLGPGQRYREDDRPAPLSAYGFSKWAGEQAVAAATDRHWIVRTQWLYGLDGPSFVATMLRLGAEVLAGERGRLAVVDDQYGSPTSTHSLAPWLWAILEREPAFGLYHGANAGECSWRELAAASFERSGWDVAVDAIPAASYKRAARTPDRSTLDTTKLATALQLTIPTWQEALDDYLARRAAAPTGSTP